MTNNKKENNIMAKNTNIDLSNVDLDALLDALADKVAARLNGLKDSGPAKDEDAAPAKRGRGKAKAEEPEEDEDDEEGDDDERLAELMKQRITTLRKQALALGFAGDDVADADKETLAESILAAEKEEADEDEDEDESEDEDADDADEDEADEEEAEFDRDELEELNLTALKKIAKEEAGYTTSDLKGLDKDAIIDMLMGEDEEGDEDEDDDEEEGEDDWYTEEELSDMSLADLKAIAKENDIPVKRGMKQDALIEAILDA